MYWIVFVSILFRFFIAFFVENSDLFLALQSKDTIELQDDLVQPYFCILEVTQTINNKINDEAQETPQRRGRKDYRSQRAQGHPENRAYRIN